MVALPDLFLISRLIWIFSIAAHFVVAAKMFRLGFGPRYRGFCVYMVAAGTQLAGLFCVRWLSSDYLWTWLATEFTIWILYIVVLLELYHLVLEDYPAIMTTGRKLLVWTLGVSVFISGLSLYADLTHAQGPQTMVVYSWILERGVLFSLTLFLLILGGFVARYRLVLRRNATLHTTLFFFYFVSSTLAYFILTLTGRTATDSVNLALLCVSSLCTTLWIVNFEVVGEKAVISSRPASEDATRLFSQLDELNTALARLGKGPDESKPS